MINNFPTISTLSDIEPYLDNNFTVKAKDGIVYVNYKFSSPEVFPHPDTKEGMFRREFRGIAFDELTGVIVSRPFHKFFNYGERNDIEFDMSWPHVVEYKHDGSMVRPIMQAGHVRLATKAGITDVAMKAEAYAATKPDYLDFMKTCCEEGITPIFEYCAPDNIIVIKHQQPSLTLLAMRDTVRGNYLPMKKISKSWGITTVGTSKNTIHTVPSAIGTEGIVVRFLGGERFKCKTEWYTKIHKIKELTGNERRVVEMILDNKLDDVLPLVNVEDRGKLLEFQKGIMDRVVDWSDTLKESYKMSRHTYGSKKSFALASQGFTPFLRSGIFYLFDNPEADMSEFVLDKLAKALSTNDKYRAMKEQLGFKGLVDEPKD